MLCAARKKKKTVGGMLILGWDGMGWAELSSGDGL